MVRAVRMTALMKDDGGVRDIVAGDMVRRLVARTISRQLGPATMALSTRTSGNMRCRHDQVASVCKG